jgi:hypothetical protein
MTKYNTMINCDNDMVVTFTVCLLFQYLLSEFSLTFRKLCEILCFSV